jgi:hypothetical protein
MKINGIIKINIILFFVFSILICCKSKEMPKNIDIKNENINAFAFKMFNKNMNCLEVIKNLEENKEFYENNESTRDQFYENLLTYSCFCNDTLRYNEYTIKRRKINKDSILYDFQKYKIKNAEDYILENINDFEIILFNERHHNTEQRIFLNQILSKLKKSGFEYLAIEALDNTENKDFLLNFNKNSGFYTKESNYSNLIKEAFNNGFKVLSYEDNINCETSKCRDSIQARNIYNKSIKNNLNSKIIVLAGGNHIFKAKGKMAFYLSKLTDKKIVSIDLMSFNKSKTYNNNSFYDQLNKKFNIKKPSVLIENNLVFKNNNYIDFNIIFPYKEMKNWQNYNKIKLTLNFKKKYFECLIQIYSKKENVMLDVPILQEIIKKEKMNFYLDKGNYIYLIKDEKNKTLKQEEIKI